MENEFARKAKLAIVAAINAMVLRGWVVIGYSAANAPFNCWKPGEYTDNFAGGKLLYHQLEVTGETSRRDWDVQFRLLFPGKADKFPPEHGQRFFRCQLRRYP